jgi:hypothetical protein
MRQRDAERGSTLNTATRFDVDHLDPDGTSIYDIRSIPYDVDRVGHNVRSASDETTLAVGCDDLDATSIYIRRLSCSTGRGDLTAARRHQIRAARQDIAGLRAALSSGWDIGPELAYEERRLAELEAT